jgi:hypothetical protein
LCGYLGVQREDSLLEVVEEDLGMVAQQVKSAFRFVERLQELSPGFRMTHDSAVGLACRDTASGFDHDEPKAA